MGWLHDQFTRYIANPIQDFVGWEGDTGRVDRANGKTYAPDPGSTPPATPPTPPVTPPAPVVTPEQKQDNTQETDLDSGGGQEQQTGPTITKPVSKVETATTGGGVESGGAGYGSTLSNVEETNTLTNQNTVSPVTEVELNNQSQSNSQGSQSQSIQSQAQKANVYQGGGVTVAPVLSFDASDGGSQGMTTWQLVLILGAPVLALWLLKPKEDDDLGHEF